MPGLTRHPAASVLAVPPGKQDTGSRLGGREDSKDLVQRHIGKHINQRFLNKAQIAEEALVAWVSSQFYVYCAKYEFI